MTPAERHDVVLILRRLSQPCPSGDEHEWRTCPRKHPDMFSYQDDITEIRKANGTVWRRP